MAASVETNFQGLQINMTDPIIFTKSFFAAFFSTLFCIWLLHPVACRIGLVDTPGGRKWHEREVPLIGGITMFCGFCFSLLILPFSLFEYRGLLAGSGLLILIGVVDDFRELGSKLRLVGQLFACFFLIVWGHKAVYSLGNLLSLGDIHLGAWNFPVTAFLVIGYINAINMIDGQDGLAGGVTLCQTISLLLISLFLGHANDTVILSIITVLISAFLLFNMPLPWRPYARIFLGDAGSTFLAFIIAWFAIDLSQTDSSVIKPITVLWILALPLFDLVNVCVYRISNGVSPFTAGRDHLHHILQMKGMNTTLSTMLLCLLSFAFGMIGLIIASFNIPEIVSFLVFVSALALYLIFVKVVRKGQEVVITSELVHDAP